MLDGTEFKDVSKFEHNGLTCLLFEYGKEVKVDESKLAVWRIKLSQLDGVWLDDYVDNRLGGFDNEEQASEAVMTM